MEEKKLKTTNIFVISSSTGEKKSDIKQIQAKGIFRNACKEASSIKKKPSLCRCNQTISSSLTIRMESEKDKPNANNIIVIY